jgi:internalin A
MKTIFRAAVSLAVFSLGSIALAACDDDKQQDLIAKTTIDAGAKAATPAVATVDAAPPSPKAKVVCDRTAPPDLSGNPALQAEVYRKLGRDGGAVTAADLKTIKSINLSQATIDSLDPCIFPLFTGVKDLFLGAGDLDDLTPIASLTQLLTLRASINKVTDITPLAKMTQMDRLDLGRTGVHDITPIANMTALTELQLDDTQVQDITPLASCKNLEKLSLRNTPVVDISPLKNAKKLRFLYVEGAPIADISPLSNLSSLKIVRKGKM